MHFHHNANELNGTIENKNGYYRVLGKPGGVLNSWGGLGNFWKSNKKGKGTLN